MRQLIARRLLLAIPLLFVVSFLSFALVAVAPGDPAVDILGLNATRAQDAALDRQLGFDQAVPVQYWHWLVNALHGDFGTSFASSQPVLTVVDPALAAAGVPVETQWVAGAGHMWEGISQAEVEKIFASSVGFALSASSATPEAFWAWCKYGCDFVLEDGAWKIWHLHVYGIFLAPYGRSWVDRPEDMIDPPPMLAGHRPDRPPTTHWQYMPDRVYPDEPAPPFPYGTFDPGTAF